MTQTCPRCPSSSGPGQTSSATGLISSRRSNLDLLLPTTYVPPLSFALFSISTGETYAHTLGSDIGRSLEASPLHTLQFPGRPSCFFHPDQSPAAIDDVPRLIFRLWEIGSGAGSSKTLLQLKPPEPGTPKEVPAKASRCRSTRVATGKAGSKQKSEQ